MNESEVLIELIRKIQDCNGNEKEQAQLNRIGIGFTTDKNCLVEEISG